MKGDILPDSRARETKGSVFTSAGEYIPFFCANCGKECGWCPADNLFIFYICQNCEDACGKITGLMRLPDEDYWELLKQEQMNHFGYYPNQQELSKVLEEDASPLATLLKQGR